MLLAIDVGNTRTKVWNITTGSRAAFPTAEIRNHDDAAGIIGVKTDQQIQIIGASVVPRAREQIDDASEDFWGSTPVWIYSSLPLGLSIRYETPDTLGADRLANAIAAAALYEAPSIVVDLGTATKVEAIDKDKSYLGGAILPGIQMGLNSLHSSTSQLPNFAPEWIDSPIGRNTKGSILSGTVLAHAHAIAGLIRSFEQAIGPSTIIFTGGDRNILHIDEQSGPFRGMNIKEESALTMLGLEQAAKRLGLRA